MREYDISTCGDTVADVYDDRHQDREDLTPVVALLAELVASGKALELGIGTGRVALPLAERGVEVHGIDSSEAMVTKLRAKRGGAAIPVTMGSFADLGVAESYALDPAMHEFFHRSNPWALRAIAERLMEAADRGLWAEPPQETLTELRRVYLRTEALLEERQERLATTGGRN